MSTPGRRSTGFDQNHGDCGPVRPRDQTAISTPADSRYPRKSTPVAGVAGMRLRSVVLESLMASRARTKEATSVGHDCKRSVDSRRLETSPDQAKL